MAGEEKKGFLRALSHRDFRRLAAALGVSRTGDMLYAVALTVFVFEETGSAAWVAAANILRLVPYVLFGAAGGVMADRYDRRRLMVASDLARAAVMVLLAVVAAASGPVALAIALAFAAATAGAPYRPAVAAVVPSLVPEDDLAPANASLSAIDYLAILVGPAIGGVLLVLGSPAAAFAVNAASFVGSALLVSGARIEARVTAESEEPSEGHRFRQGLGAVRQRPDVAVLIAFLTAATFAYGLEIVLLPLVAERRLGTGAKGLWVLEVGVGLGGLVAAGFSSRLGSERHLRRSLLLIVAMFSLPLALLTVVRSPVLAGVIMTLEGAGNLAFDVIILTTIQRSVPSGLLGRVGGITDSLAVGGMLGGLLLAPVLLRSALDLRGTLLVAAALLPVLMLLFVRPLRELDRRARARLEELAPRVEVLEGLGIFEGADRAALEAVAGALVEETVLAGQVVVREGDPAEDFFVVRSGTLGVTSSGAEGPIPSLGPGDWFGEIGLLEEVPRTATVEASTEAHLYRVDGDTFLAAVTREPAVPSMLFETVSTRLARTRPASPPREAI